MFFIWRLFDLVLRCISKEKHANPHGLRVALLWVGNGRQVFVLQNDLALGCHESSSTVCEGDVSEPSLSSWCPCSLGTLKLPGRQLNFNELVDVIGWGQVERSLMAVLEAPFKFIKNVSPLLLVGDRVHVVSLYLCLELVVHWCVLMMG